MAAGLSDHVWSLEEIARSRTKGRKTHDQPAEIPAHAWVRDKAQCQYCGLSGRDNFDVWMNLTIDHIIPGYTALYPKRVHEFSAWTSQPA